MQIFTSYCLTSSKGMPCYLIIIIGMHWLSKLNHYKVGYVYNIIDGADTSTLKALLHPFRRWPNLYILKNSCRKTAAKLWCINANPDKISSLGIIILVNLDFRPLWLISSKNSHLTNKTEYAEAVCAICCQLKLQYNIIQAKNLFSRNTNRGTLWQNVNAYFLLLWQLSKIKLQLLSRAEHTIGSNTSKLTLRNLHAIRQMSTNHSNRNNLALPDIGGTSYNLNRFRLSHIHTGNNHMI